MRHKNINFAVSEHRKNTRMLSEFFLYNKSSGKYQMLAFCAKDSVEIDNLTQSPGRSVFLD